MHLTLMRPTTDWESIVYSLLFLILAYLPVTFPEFLYSIREKKQNTLVQPRLLNVAHIGKLYNRIETCAIIGHSAADGEDLEIQV